MGSVLEDTRRPSWRRHLGMGQRGLPRGCEDSTPPEDAAYPGAMPLMTVDVELRHNRDLWTFRSPVLICAVGQ